MLQEFDVIIVGCGPVGAVAATLLGRRGTKTLIIDRATTPYDLPRAVHIDHEVMRILQSANLARKVLPLLSVPAGAMHVGADLGVIRQLQKHVVTERLGWASDYFFFQPELETVLREELSLCTSVTALFGHTLGQVTQSDSGVHVSIVDAAGSVTGATGKYLLACDGAKSAVRGQLGIELIDLGFDEPWLVVDAKVRGPITFPAFSGVPHGTDLQKVMIMVGDPRRPMSIIPGVRDHRRWEFMVLPGETMDQVSAPHFIRELLAPWLKDVEHEVIRCAVYRFHALIATHWQSNRIFLLGDSAHQTPPFFGQGLCHGIRDAANIIWKLDLVLRGLAPAGVLETYQKEREPQVRKVIDASIKTGEYICTLNATVAEQRDRSMRAVANRTPAAYVDIIPPIVTGLIDLDALHLAATGSRFIQPPVRAANGTTALLDDQTDGGFVLLSLMPVVLRASLADDIQRWSAIGGAIFTILSRDTDPESVAPDELLDVTGELVAWFECHRCRSVILRPDAYVYGTASDCAGTSALVNRLLGALDVTISQS